MKKRVYLMLAVMAMLVTVMPGYSQIQPHWQVDKDGNLTVDGQLFQIKGGSWFGLQGREESSNEPTAYTASPMELYIGNVFWAPSGRTYEKNIREFKDIGFNVIRLPVVSQTLDPDEPQGKQPYLKNHSSVIIENARLALETVIKKLDEAGLYVVLDIHSCSNYVGWRAGRLDARPPYPDRDFEYYDFLKEDCSCASTNNPPGVTFVQEYSEEKWLKDLQTLAALPYDLGVSNIMGIDIFNEPWDYTWEEWRLLIDKAFKAVNEINPNILIFAQGVSSIAGAQDGTPNTLVEVPHGDEFTKPGYGENLYEAGFNPPSMPKNRLVYSPHVYGPSVYVHRMFMDPRQPECQGVEGDEAGDLHCNIVVNPKILKKGWEEHFGYLKKMGYALVIGEFGGNMDWPDKAPVRDQRRYHYLNDNTHDFQWQQAFVEYLVENNILDTIYWAINPESQNKSGIYDHAYDPVSNTDGWGIWLAPDQRKVDLLESLWNPQPTSTTSPTVFILGDVNYDSVVNIVDAMLIAAYFVYNDLENFNKLTADVDCSEHIDMIDALLVAQYYVGLIDWFCN